MFSDVLQASDILRLLHQRHLVHKYVTNISEDRKQQLGEKVVAEGLFKNKKSSYAQSVGESFEKSRCASRVALNGINKRDVKVTATIMTYV